MRVFDKKNLPKRNTKYLWICLVICFFIWSCSLKNSTEPKVSLDEKLTSIINGQEFEFVKVPAGFFEMGFNSDLIKIPGHVAIEPVHKVEITHSFQIGKYEVTMEQWDAFMESNPSRRSNAYEKEVKKLQKLDPAYVDSWTMHWMDRSKSENIPVDSVTWEEVQEFVTKLNNQDSKYQYRLPTEAEWEYACRIGIPETSSEKFDEIAHWFGNAGNEWKDRDLPTERLVGPKMPLPVGSKKPNLLGIYDMQGNVWEWVQDWYGPHSSQSKTDPKGPTESEAEVFEYRGVKTAGKVFKGGSWLSWGFMESELNPAYRDRRPPNFRHTDLGFRLIRFLK